MPSSYPAALDSLPNPVSGGPGVGTDLDTATPGLSHAEQHQNANNAIEAVQAVLGLNPQGAETDVATRLDVIEDVVIDIDGRVDALEAAPPPSAGTLTLADVALTAVSQSSVFAGTTAGTPSNLSDGNGATGTGTNAVAKSYVQVEWSGTKVIVAVRFGGGAIAGFGGTGGYVTSAMMLEYWDGSAFQKWCPPALVPNRVCSNSGVDQFVTYQIPPIATTKLRLVSASYVGMTEFVPIELQVA